MCARRSRLENRTFWGHIDHTLPPNPNRTSYGAAHRPIPPIVNYCKAHRPLTADSRRFNSQSSYRTSSAAYGSSKIRSCSSAYEKPLCSNRIHYNAHEQMFRWSRGFGRQHVSEMRSNYKCAKRTESPVDCPVSGGDVTFPGRTGRNQDHCVTTNRQFHQYFPDERSLSSKSCRNDTVTFWSDQSYPKTIGLNGSCRKIWMPPDPAIKHAAWGNENFAIRQMDKTLPRTIAWIGEGYLSETNKSFVPPYHGFVHCE